MLLHNFCSFRVSQFIESKTGGGRILSFSNNEFLDMEANKVICTIDEVSPVYKRLIKTPSHVRFGATRFSHLPKQTGKN